MYIGACHYGTIISTEGRPVHHESGADTEIQLETSETYVAREHPTPAGFRHWVVN